MDRKLKLIWDFRGADAEKTAGHHETHLREYIAAKRQGTDITGHTKIHELHAIAYMVVPEADMVAVRDALRPHRGEVYQGTDNP